MRKRITVKIVTDALGILSADTLQDNLYMFDDNRRGGSYGEGTSGLVTVLDFHRGQPEEYEIIWLVMNMRPDVAVEIEDMRTQSDAVRIERHKYDETDISYWIMHVRTPLDSVEGTLSLRIAGRDVPFTHRFTINGKETGQ